jgi:hypothetical protein
LKPACGLTLWVIRIRNTMCVRKPSKTTNGPKTTWNTNARPHGEVEISRPIKAHLNWEIGYEPPHPTAVAMGLHSRMPWDSTAVSRVTSQP